MKKINLGAGLEPLEGWVNTDWYDLPGIDKVFNLLKLPLPFDDSSASVIRAWDVLEHMPSHDAKGRSYPIEFMNEAWRILEKGGQLILHVPDARCPETWTDISHVRGYMPNSFDHFCPETELGGMFPFYSERKWKKLLVKEANKNIEFRLEKII